MSLKDQVAFVAGGAGIVGSGFVKSLLEAGADVWTAIRSEKSVEELKELISPKHLDHLHIVRANISNESEIIKIRDEILKTHGKINHVVSSIGGWILNGLLSDVTAEDFQKHFIDLTLVHFNVYKTFAKHLSEIPNSTYTFISGGSGESRYFEPQASLIPIGSSTVYGMFTAAASEFKDHKNLAIMQFRLFLWIRKQPDSDFDAKNSEYEVGHDYIGKFLPKLIEKHKSEIYKIQSRTKGDELYNELQNN